MVAKANPWINLSTREYGNAGNGRVLLFLIIGIIGTILCVWVSEFLEYIPLISEFLAIMGRKTLSIFDMNVASVFLNMGDNVNTEEANNFFNFTLSNN